MQIRSSRVRRPPIPKDVELLPSVTRPNHLPDAQDETVQTQRIEGATSSSGTCHQEEMLRSQELAAARQEEPLPPHLLRTEPLGLGQIRCPVSRTESVVHSDKLAATTGMWIPSETQPTLNLYQVTNPQSILLYLGVKTPTITQALVVGLQLTSALLNGFTAHNLLDAVSTHHLPNLSTLRSLLQGQSKTYLATSNHPIPIGAPGYSDPYNGYRTLGSIGEPELKEMNQVLPAAQSPLRTLLLDAQRCPPETELYVMYIEQEVCTSVRL
jgi:hypothetical protein